MFREVEEWWFRGRGILELGVTLPDVTGKPVTMGGGRKGVVL